MFARDEQRRDRNERARATGGGRRKAVRGRVVPEGEKWCPRCAQALPKNEFGRNNASKDGRSTYCAVCNSEMVFERRLLLEFNMTVAQYELLFEMQNQRCAICKKQPRKMRLAVDHDHLTGKVRGLLCKRCNHDLLGSAHDSVEILYTAIDYLERPPADLFLRTVPVAPTKPRRQVA